MSHIGSTAKMEYTGLTRYDTDKHVPIIRQYNKLPAYQMNLVDVVYWDTMVEILFEINTLIFNSILNVATSDHDDNMPVWC